MNPIIDIFWHKRTDTQINPIRDMFCANRNIPAGFTEMLVKIQYTFACQKYFEPCFGNGFSRNHEF